MSSEQGGQDKTRVLHDKLAPTLLAGMNPAQRKRADGLLAELLEQWAWEAGANELSASVYDILERELVAASHGKNEDERFDLLWAEVVDRRLRVVSVATYALGQRVIDHAVSDEEARRRGHELLAQVEVLAAEVRSVTDPTRRRLLERTAQDAMLEALYAVERKAMSLRLERYRADRAGGAFEKPPELRP